MTTKMSNKFIVQAENIHKNYRSGRQNISVLRGVSLSLQQGEFIAIMGASGSGKSTLLHILGGLLAADEGYLRIEDIELTAPQLNDESLTQFRRRRLGMIFQAYNLIPTLTVEENILLPIRMERKVSPEDLSFAQELQEGLGIWTRREHLPEALSGGEQQRVAIARALITRPALILADEPTGNLDSVTSQEICDQFRNLCKKHHRTLVLVTHEASAAFVADKTLILRDGVLVNTIDNRTLSDCSELACQYLKHSLSPTGV